MKLTKKLKIMMLEKDMKQSEIAEKIGLTKQSINNYLSRDNFINDILIKIADVLGYDTKVTFVDRETGKEI